MLMWIQSNLANIIVCAVLALVVGAIIVRMVKSKKQGKSSCGCGCSGCSAAGSCHGAK